MKILQKYPVASLIITSVLIRLFAVNMDIGYETDINCFKAWSNMLFTNGLSNFYLSDSFTDYPPGYMYVLWIIGFLQNMMRLSSDGFTILVKIPAMLCDIVAGWIIYKLAVKNNIKYALTIALAYVMNPAVIIDSSIWGQVDAITTLIIISSIYFLTEKRLLYSYLIFAAGILVKPQILMFSPIYMFSAYSFLNENRFSKEAFLQLARYAAICISVIILAVLPFTQNFDLTPIFKQYTNTIGSYPYASLNAYNFYSLIGANWADVSGKFIFLSYSAWGMLFIQAIVLLSIFLLYSKPLAGNYFYVAGLINILTFMFSTRMHERYIFPSLALFLIAFIYLGRKSGTIALYIGFSITMLVNCIAVLIMIKNGNNLVSLESTVYIFSMANLVLTIYMIAQALYIIKNNIDNNGKGAANRTKKRKAGGNSFNKQAGEAITQPLPAMSRLDYCLAGGLMLFYGIIAFINLGETEAPQTVWTPIQDSQIVVEFEDVEYISDLRFFNGARHEEIIQISYSLNGTDWEFLPEMSTQSVFHWTNEYVDFECRYVVIKAVSENVMINEFAFISEGEIIQPKAMTGGNELFDERYLVVDKSTFLNDTYFDEIYHARTAYEFTKKLPVYEWTHPPLGKVIISWGIMIFGMTPFGWRFAGAFFGCLMIPLIYTFGKKLFKTSYWAFFSAFIFTFDFMHFAQTRIATIDTFVTFFIIAMYYFMYKYYCSDFNEPLRKQLIPLALSGFFMGCAIASKWPGIYAGAGLAVIFFYALYLRYKNYSAELFRKMAYPTIKLCFVFFVGVPLIIYGLSYIPFLQVPYSKGLVTIIDNQKDMYNYHSTLVSEHPFSSTWVQWPLNIRPMFFYSERLIERSSGISSFGNPLVWWVGFGAVLYAISQFYKNRDKNLAFLFIALLAQYLPWCLVPRTTYIYHFFPSVPFIIFFITYLFTKIDGKKHICSTVYGILVFQLFVLFYPVLSGYPINAEFVHKYLEWLPTWVLI